ncbi:MAG: Lrp/AsnC family transcriptional regulator [Nanoarchaeota archaeon]
MDLIDKKILALLDENSRIPLSKIAKKLKISRQVADYRINQLVKNKIILHFTSFIDPTKFYSNIWHIYLKLQNLTTDSEKEIIDYLDSKDYIWWISKCQGEWDLIFAIIGEDIISFDKQISEFKSKFHNFISQHYITSMIKAYKFPRGYFLNKPTIRQEYISKRTKVKIDEKDLAILKLIGKNSRMPSTKIAEKTKLTPRQVIYRIKELINKEVIREFSLHLNFKELRYDYYKVCFYTQNFTEKSEQEIVNWCESCPNAIYFVKKISPWTFEIEFETEDYKQLNNILSEIRNKFGDIIRRTETTLIIEEFKGEMNLFN